MSIAIIGTYAAGIFLLIGALFTLVGAIGLLKLDDAMKRLHAPTKVGTMGIGAMLLGSITIAFVQGSNAIHELLIMAFLFATAPISANFLSKVNIHKKCSEEPPKLDDDQTWSTLVQREEDLVGNAQSRKD